MSGEPIRKAFRWLRPTPDRLVVALLALEVFLLLSERFEWFAFKQHKGYAPLIAVASVCAAVLLMFLWFLSALVFRLRFQYSLRSLLIFMLLASIGMAWFFPRLRAARQQRDAVAAIRAIGAKVTYDYQAEWYAQPRGSTAPTPELLKAWSRQKTFRYSDEFHDYVVPPPGPAWARTLLGVDYLADVIEVGHFWPISGNRCRAGPNPITDACLEQIAKLPRLRVLNLEGSEVSDDGLKLLKGLRGLRKLNLWQTRITDTGLRELQGLTKLRELNLQETRIADAGLRELQTLSELQELNVERTGITDRGLKYLGRIARLDELDLGCTNVTDTGLETLAQFRGLRSLRSRRHSRDIQRRGESSPRAAVLRMLLG